MNDRDCESCKKFSRNDPHESEGYCDAKRTWVDPQEGEDCKMHEFTLCSATKYKDGTTMMKENKFGVDFCEEDCCPHWEKKCGHTLEDKHMCPYLPHDTDSNLKYLEQVFTEFAKVQDDIIADYDEKLKDHHERITINEGNIDSLCLDVKDLQRKVYAIYKFFNAISPNVFFDICKGIEELAHKGSDFCGNCTHCHRGKQGDDTVYVCDLSKEVVDPDDSSCTMFEPPF